MSKSFSYTVKVSRDKSNWLELFDYSSFSCREPNTFHFLSKQLGKGVGGREGGNCISGTSVIRSVSSVISAGSTIMCD